MDRKNLKLPGRREFIKNMALTSAGVVMVPSVLSCGSMKKSISNAAVDDSNLIFNGNFELADTADPMKPAGWNFGPGLPSESAILSKTNVHSGSQSLLQRRTVSEDFYYQLSQKVPLERGALYRLRLHAMANEKAQDMFAVCISAQGDEGPDWLYQPIELKAVEHWQAVDFVFRAQSGFNPLHSADIQFRLNQWRPDFSFRPNRPQDREVQQELYIDSVSLVKITEGTRVPGRLSRWLLVPGHEKLRMADVKLGAGDGISMVPGSVRIARDGKPMKRVTFLEKIRDKEEFAYSERSRRVYMLSDDASAEHEFSYEISLDNSGDGLLGICSLTGRALRDGVKEITRVALQFDKKNFDRNSWPVTQGLPFSPGILADLSALRVLGPNGREIPAQVKATSFWADDSVRWALLDFCVTIPAGRESSYFAEFGPGIIRSDVSGGIEIKNDGNGLMISNGRLQFIVSKKNFRLLEELRVDGHEILDGPAVLSVSQDDGKTFTTDREPPYSVVVEEAGPMRTVIAVHGWNVNEGGEKFLTYTTRIHVYRNQSFVRVFHSLTNRHEKQVTGKHPFANGWPNDESLYQYVEIPQRNIADATFRIKPKGMDRWSFYTNDDTITGTVAEGISVHRQLHHEEGLLTTPNEKIKTSIVPGIVRIECVDGTMTASVFRYSNLFPKETRIGAKGIELGIISSSDPNPHPLIEGTARTTELLLTFDPAGSDSGILSARCFTEPTLFSNEKWYCDSLGFMGDPLIPVNRHTIGSYDRLLDSYVENAIEPYPRGVDDCGLLNYGCFIGVGYNHWFNMIYDGDLGLYMHFARSGDRRAFIRGLDATRHFLDADTRWYTGDFLTQGSNFQSGISHYRDGRTDAHINTLGVIHYYLLTGDRRGLEATRINADCVNRNFYHRTRQYASLFTEDDVVGVERSYRTPGGPARTLNARSHSNPARYVMHSYLATGEARFLDATLSITEGFVVRWPEVWRPDDDQYIHYRWPQVIGRLYDLTGQHHFKEILIKCGKWMLENPYAKYGEYRVSQSYGRGVQTSGTNNTRMMFLTAWAWKITGERPYLDWMINMFDFLVERDRHKALDKDSSKDLGKEGDNPARGAALVVPHRTVLIDHSPSRFHIVPPGEGVWKLIIGNTSETPLKGKVSIGPMPEGIQMETNREFQLELGQEITLEYSIKFAQHAGSGRHIIPYRITTIGSDGYQGERNVFFAAHLLKPRTAQLPELLFHAPLNDASPAYTFSGSGKLVIENEDFVSGRGGKRALGANSQGWSFDLKGNIFPDAGTFSIWIKSNGRTPPGTVSLVRVLGYGWPFLAINTNEIRACDQPCKYEFTKRSGEWVHVAIRWDIKELAYFIDGRNIYKNKRINFEMPTGELWGFLQGAMACDDIRVFSVPLSEDRIKELSRGE